MSVTIEGTRSTPWDYRGLIWNFTRRDLKARYRGTLLGWLWSLVVPIATLLIYAAVFSAVFRIQPPPFGNGQPGNYAIWLMVGLVLYSYLATSVNLSIPTLLGAGTLLQKVYIPSYVPVIGASLATAIQTGIEVGILLIILAVLGNIGLTWLLLPVLLFIYLVFVVSTALLIAITTVYFRDVAQIVAVALQLLVFVSPVIYPLEQVPETWNGIPLQTLISMNPLTGFINSVRDVTYGLTMPNAAELTQIVLWTAGLVAAATVVYLRKGRDIGEAV